ncbi:hypothetical protein FBU30_005478 [Linnemannia zychae]|nr:hypothetical protein FBU30_005478 [Linnemannia zychae]
MTQRGSGPSGSSHASFTHRAASTTASAIPTTSSTAIHNTVTPSLLSASAAADAQAKRGRGRPKKPNSNDNDDGEEESSSESSIPEAAPRKRGRPPKLNKVVKPPVDPSLPKRGRGRPRKNPQAIDGEAAGVSGSASASNTAQNSSTSATGHHASAAEPPRKRGRPRKD